MPEQVQIDLVVNTAQLDVAEARYDALKARQLGLQGGTAAPGLGVPGAMAGAAVLTQMQNASTMQRLLHVAQRRQAGLNLIGPETAAVLGFTEKFAGSTFSMADGYLKAQQTGEAVSMMTTGGPMALPGQTLTSVTGMSPFRAADQNMYGKDYLTRQYLMQTGRLPEPTLSAQEIYAQTVAFESQKKMAQQIVAQAAIAPPLTQTATAAANSTIWGKAKKAVSLLSSSAAGRFLTKKVGGLGKGATKIGRFGGAMIALAALNNFTDDIIEDGEFRAAAGIPDSEGEGIADRGAGKSIIQFARDIDASLISPFAKLYAKAAAPFASYATTNDRIRRIEENLKAIRAGGYGVMFSHSARGAALRADATIKRARGDMLGQNEWSKSFEAGLQEIESRADSIAQDFSQRVYGGGDVGRSEVAAWVKQSAVQYQKGKFAEEAWKQHPNARIAKDPPKE